jgi:hypothetical protein
MHLGKAVPVEYDHLPHPRTILIGFPLCAS